MNGRIIMFLLFVILVPAAIQTVILNGYRDIADDVIDDSKYLSSLAKDLPTAKELQTEGRDISFSRGAIDKDFQVTPNQRAINYKERSERNQETLHTQKFLGRLPSFVWPIFLGITFAGYLLYTFISGGTGVAGFGQRLGAAILGSVIFSMVDISIATLIFSVIVRLT